MTHIGADVPLCAVVFYMDRLLLLSGGGRYSDSRYSDNCYNDISKWVMQWVRVRIRVRTRDRLRAKVC